MFSITLGDGGYILLLVLVSYLQDLSHNIKQLTEIQHMVHYLETITTVLKLTKQQRRNTY